MAPGNDASRDSDSSDHELARTQRDVNEQLVLSSLRAHEAADLAEATSRELRASEEQLRTLADTLPLLSWYANPDGDVVWYNRRWFEYTGSTLDAQRGWGWESVQDPDDLPRVVARWKRALASGEPWEDEFRLRRHDGEWRWFLSRAVPLRDAGGRIVRWFGTNFDVDDQRRAAKEAQERDEAAREDLEHSLAWERKMAELRERLLGILGHDLRSPLNAVLVGAGVLLAHGNQNADDTGVVNRILSGAHRMERMIVQILDFTRARLGGILRLEMRPTDVGEICRTVAEELALGAPVAVSCSTDGDLRGSWDPDRLAEVIANIAGNAVQHAWKGTTVVLHARDDGPQVVISATNEGSPIPADVLPVIFEPFRRAEQREKAKAGNLGLGLFIAHEFTRAHGGTIEARSADGKTVFTVCLPRCPPAAPSTRAVVA